jgi:hypothetical protein
MLLTIRLAEAIDTTRIHSVAGLTGRRTACVTTRPCRAPHDTMSVVGLIGGGQAPMPGEVSLAHHGVLCLDELPEFRRHVLAVPRQPLNGDEITGSRLRVKVVRNKVATPFRQAEFDMLYGEGISRAGDLLDLASERGLVTKSVAWYAYQGDRIGQGREHAKTSLKEHPEVASAVAQQLRQTLGLTRVAAEPPAEPICRMRCGMTGTGRCNRHPRGLLSGWQTTRHAALAHRASLVPQGICYDNTHQRARAGGAGALPPGGDVAALGDDPGLRRPVPSARVFHPSILCQGRRPHGAHPRAAPVLEALNGRLSAWERASGGEWQGFPNTRHERPRPHPTVLADVDACRGNSPRNRREMFYHTGWKPPYSTS